MVGFDVIGSFLKVKMHARRYLAKLEHERRAPDDAPSDAKYVIVQSKEDYLSMILLSCDTSAE